MKNLDIQADLHMMNKKRRSNERIRIQKARKDGRDPAERKKRKVAVPTGLSSNLNNLQCLA